MKPFFASPEKADKSALESDIEFARTHSMVQELVEMIPAAFAVLNTHRQIVFCNPTLLKTIGVKAPEKILAAEKGNLELLLSPVNKVEVLNAVMGVYKEHNAARGRLLEIALGIENIDFATDSRLLTRVIGNMVKNALEAETKGQN